ncbi:unnamed protein product [Merluccius merluccius]
METGKSRPLLCALLTLATLLSGTRGTPGAPWEPPAFCGDYKCPDYSVQYTSDDYEERKYVETQWLTTGVQSVQVDDLTDGFKKLKSVCDGNNEGVHKVNCKTWPALITVTQGESDAESVSVSWFFPPEVDLPTPLDTSVSKEVRPAGIVYVRTFPDPVNKDTVSSNLSLLRKALAGKPIEHHRYTGAGYNNPWDIFKTHHNEIWVNAVPQDQKSK